jgi:hypothetical protein
VTVDAKGNLSFKGTLADGTAVTQGTTVSRDGHWPLYVSVNQGRGILIGWITFADEVQSDLQGLNINWVKLMGPDRYYPDGFALECEALGSRYAAPVTSDEGSLATLAFQGAGLGEDLVSQVLLNAKNQVLVFGENPAKLKLTYAPASGMFSGSFQPAGTPKPLTLKGAVLQKGAQSGGFYLDATQSGRVGVSWDPQAETDRSVLVSGSVAGFTINAHVDEATEDFRRLLFPSSFPPSAATENKIPRDVTLNFDFTGSSCSLRVDYDDGLSQMITVRYSLSLSGATGKLTLLVTPKVAITLSFTGPTEGSFEAKYISGLKGTMTGTFSTLAIPVEVLENRVIKTGITGDFGARRLLKINVPTGQTELNIATFHAPWIFRTVDVAVKYKTPPSSTSHDYILDDDHDADLLTIKNPKAGDWYILLNFSDGELDLLVSYGNSASYNAQISPQKQNVTAEGGRFDVQVTADLNAELTAISSQTWIEVEAPWIDMDRWVLSYYVTENWFNIIRSAVIMIGDRFLVINQAAGP